MSNRSIAYTGATVGVVLVVVLFYPWQSYKAAHGYRVDINPILGVGCAYTDSDWTGSRYMVRNCGFSKEKEFPPISGRKLYLPGTDRWKVDKEDEE